MKKLIIITSLLFVACQSSQKSGKHDYSRTEPIPQDSNQLISNQRQLTFAGKRTGEGYFSPDGELMVMQSEREANNPFYQIYLQNLETGKTTRISPGKGKTTCAWIHPSKKKVMFASTHLDKNTEQIMQAEIEERSSGKKKRYSWDYDENYDLFEATTSGRITKRLTREKGYDAEGSYSPDGNWIAFASNRHAYSDKLTAEQQQALAQNSSHFMEIYIMRADGTGVKRLTTSPGYDGGPFFSPDGKKITWRRFSADGHTAEVFTMNVDGSEQKQITNLGKMSWAPYYHPSGDYIAFATNKHGYKNFEIYIVDAEGESEPVRVTYLEGFDGLPVFTPDGSQLTWTRRDTSHSQIHIADWNDQRARELLNLQPSEIKTYELKPAISEYDIKRIVYYLAQDNMNGRPTGSKQEEKYTKNFTNLFASYGLKPLFGKSYVQEFEFASGSELGLDSRLALNGTELKLFEDWTPLHYSGTGEFDVKDVVFAGYGLIVPEQDEIKGYNSYEDVDVKGKWALVLNYEPDSLTEKERLHFHRYSRLVNKVMFAREQGAKGLIVVNGPNSKATTKLVPFIEEENIQASDLPVITVSLEVLERFFLKTTALKNLQRQLDSKQNGLLSAVSNPTPIFSFDNLDLNVEITHKTGKGRNVAAMLKVPGARRTLVIGAHADHLGHGKPSSSLMNSSHDNAIHNGADDNASGVAGVVELAQYFSENRKGLKQNIVFALWSAEEIGVIGSKKFLEAKPVKNISAYLNMDMIGRYDKSLIVNAVGSSPDWTPLLESSAANHKLALSLNTDPYVPTDGLSFYMDKHPSLTFFTGAHQDYHTPADTAEKLNYKKTAEIVNFVRDVADRIVTKNLNPKYKAVTRSQTESHKRRGFNIYLGTIPDYSDTNVKGVKLSGVIKGGPAEKAGLKEGDVIVQFGSHKIENIYDYVYTLQALKPNQKTQIVVLRDNDSKSFDITPIRKE